MYKKFVVLLVGLLIAQPCYAVGLDETCSSNPCDSGLFCQEDAILEQKTCQRCSNLPANAHWSGPGRDDDPTSCPWKCNTGYYEYDDLCYECPYGSTSTSDGKGCYWENATFSDNNGPVPVTTTGTLQLSESLLEKARAQQ